MESLEHVWSTLVPDQPTIQVSSQPRKRFRDSCDNCGSSKVKCSKDRPTCTRCMDRGLYCFYSPSQRSKPRTVQLRDSEDGMWPNCIISQGLISPKSDVVKENTLIGDAAFEWDDSMFADIDSSGSNDSFPKLSPSPLAWPSLTSTTATAQQQVTNPSPSEVPRNQPIPCSFEGISLLLNSNALMLTTPEPAPVFPMDGLPVPKCKFARMDATVNYSHSSEDCMTLALNAIASLHSPTSSCTFFSPSDTPPSLLTTDERLSTATTIINNLARIQSCTCTLDPHLQLTLAVLISKTLAWYKATIPTFNLPTPIRRTMLSSTSMRSSSSPGDTGEKSTTNLDAPPTLKRKASASYVLPSGKYHLDSTDDDDGAKACAQLVLSKLHHVARLMEQFIQRFRDQQNAMMVPRDAEGRFEGMTDNLELFMRQRIRATTREIVNVL